MNEENDKSLEDQIKEAQIEKIRAETEDVRKRLKQVRIMGIPIVQIVFGGIVVGFILLNYLLPIISLDSDLERKKTELIEKKSEYDKIIGWIERVKLDSINITLIKERMNLIKDKKRQDSTNIALTKMALDLQVESQSAKKTLLVLQWEQRKRQSEIDSLNEKLREAKLAIKDLDSFNNLEQAINRTFPEVKAAIKVAEVFSEVSGFTTEYILFPKWYSEALIIDKQNADSYMRQRDKIMMVDSLQQEIIALQDSILSLEGQNR